MRRPVLFPESIWGPDLAATTAVGREVAAAARARYEKQGGVPEADLRSCADPGPDGTRLPRCLKVYLGPPTARGRGSTGNFRMIFVPTVDGLVFIAFGVAHHPKGSRKPTVYELAHARVNG